MILTYYVVATTEQNALDQFGGEGLVPYYCGTNKATAEAYCNQANTDPTNLSKQSVFLVHAIVERVR